MIEMRRAYGLLSLVLLALSAYAPFAVARDDAARVRGSQQHAVLAQGRDWAREQAREDLG